MIGRSIGPYEIEAELGSGGMGVVYRAREPRLGRDVAIKGLSSEFAGDPTRLARLESEARAVAALNHPNIVTIHSVEDVGGEFFLVMELVEGQTLDRAIPEEGLPLAELLDLAIPVAEALGAAHAKGIVHRDLKPPNVMITPDGLVKILDFGLASMNSRGAAVVTDELPTQDEALRGTIYYMSPEQLGELPVDHRTDIYAFGVVLFEMATGQRPFHGSLAHIVSAILKERPPVVNEVRTELPGELGKIIRRCLEKKTARRYQSMVEVQVDLENLRQATGSSRPILASPRRHGLFARRFRLVSALSLLAIAGALSMLLWEWRPPDGDAESSIAVLPFVNLGHAEDEFFAAGMSDEITNRLGRLSGLRVISRRSAQQYAGSSLPLHEIAEQLHVDYLLEGTVRWAPEGSASPRVRVTQQLIRAADDTQIWSGAFDRELEDVFAIQSEIASTVVGYLGLTLLESEEIWVSKTPTTHLDAYKSYLQAVDPNRTVDFRRRVANDRLIRTSLERALKLDPPFELAWSELVQHHAILYGFRFDRSREREVAARVALDRMLELAPESPYSHRALGFYHQVVTRDYPQAVEQYSLAAAMLPSDARVQRNLGSALRRQGRWQEAAAHYRRSAMLDPKNVAPPNRLGVTLTHLRRYPEAIDAFEVAMALRSEQTTAYIGKAQALWLWTGGVEGAREVLSSMPEPDTEVWFWQEIYEGRYRDALDRLRASEDAWIGKPVYFRPRSLLIAFTHSLLGETEPARLAWAKAREQLRAELETSPENEKLWSALGVTEAGLGREREAIEAGLKAVELAPLEAQPFFGQVQVEDLAWIYTLLGKSGAALGQLESLLRIPSSYSMPLLELDPRWQSLREHFRFVELKRDFGKSIDDADSPGE